MIELRRFSPYLHIFNQATKVVHLSFSLPAKIWNDSVLFVPTTFQMTVTGAGLE